VNHWTKVEDLFHAALDQPPDQRIEFLRQSCPDDRVRDEVQALLDNVKSDGFMEGSPLSRAQSALPALMPGDRLGSFEILALIGRGGMGEVYKARDTRLDRIVALKRSQEQFSARFEREARAIAALNHPNICTLYDVGPDYLVIEFIEGVPLRRQIGGKALLPAQVIQIAMQIAEALTAAHAKGIIHRDIKPDNILVNESKSGRVQVKVLDFGLARVAEETTPAPLTSAGSTLGTVAYMSPEQAKGEKLDARTDLFSLGVVLYEMATGRPPFAGATNAVLFNAILASEPESPATSEDLDPIILKLLEKDRDLRYQSAADLLADLRRIERDLSKTHSAAEKRPSGVPRRQIIWNAAALTAIGAGAFLLPREHRENEPVYRLTIDSPKLDISDGGRIALSRDGRRIAFITTDQSGTHLMVRALDSDVTQTIGSAEGALNYPVWSPDGRSIAYFTRDSLNTVDLATGQMTRLAKTLSITRGAAWGREGLILVSGLVNRYPFAIYAIPQAGGEAKQVTFTEPGNGGHVYPQFLPDGKRFLFSVFRGQTSKQELRMGTIGSRETRSVGTFAGNVMVAGHKALIFRNGESLYAQRYQENTMSLVGEPVRLADNVHYQSVNGFGAFSASETGVLAYRRGGNSKTRLRWFDRYGKPLSEIGQADSYGSFDLWQDGTRIAAVRQAGSSGGADQVWIGDDAHGASIRLNSGSESEEFVAWAPDGTRLCYTVDRRTLMLREFASGRSDRVLFKNSLALRNPAWHPGGHLIAVEERTPGFSSRIVLVSVDTDGPSAPLIPSERFSQTMPQFSPDGKWIAYCSDETGEIEIYVRPFPDVTRGKWAISTIGGAVQPRWRADGREILYVRRPTQFVSVAISSSGTTFRAGEPKPLFTPNLLWNPTVRFQYALSKDGRRILANVLSEEEDRSIEIIIRWDTLLK